MSRVPIGTSATSRICRVLIPKSDTWEHEATLNRSRFSNSRNNNDESIQINEISSSEQDIMRKSCEQSSSSSRDKRKYAETSGPSTDSSNFRLKQKLRLEITTWRKICHTRECISTNRR